MGQRYGKDSYARGGVLWSHPEGSPEVCEKTEVYGKQVDCPTMGTIPNEELENQIAENIFDWWISGKSYEEWYATKFLQGKIDFEYEDEE